MEYEIQPNTWTFVGETGVEVKYEGTSGPQTLLIDDQGAVLLPAITPSELAGESVWMVRPGSVPVTRVGEPFNLADPQWWPGGFTLVDGMWKPA